ncbi:MAG TPA: hypothetical protein DEP36_11840 [Gammaproteobacteria bacterium]|nr:hypothetical protein [Gammaproteobacteria bacterium]
MLFPSALGQALEGNVDEITTSLLTLKTVLERYPIIRWLILIADCGLYQFCIGFTLLSGDRRLGNAVFSPAG